MLARSGDISTAAAVAVTPAAAASRDRCSSAIFSTKSRIALAGSWAPRDMRTNRFPLSALQRRQDLTMEVVNARIGLFPRGGRLHHFGVSPYLRRVKTRKTSISANARKTGDPYERGPWVAEMAENHRFRTRARWSLYPPAGISSAFVMLLEGGCEPASPDLETRTIEEIRVEHRPHIRTSG